jgi:hypothetical protein
MIVEEQSGFPNKLTIEVVVHQKKHAYYYFSHNACSQDLKSNKTGED